MSIAIILVCITGVFVGIIPAALRTFEQLTAVRELSDQTNALGRKLEMLDAIDETTIRDDLVTVLSAVPGEKSLPTVFSTVEVVAQQAGVHILDMNMAGAGSVSTQSGAQSALEKQLGTRVIPFSLTVEGSIDQIQQFISLVPTVRRLLRLRNFSISFPKQNESLRVNVQMDAFYEPFPTALGKTSTALSALTDKEAQVVAQLSQFMLATQDSGKLPLPLIGPGKLDPFSP